MDDPDFCELVEQAEEAIDLNIQPTLISQGSSGSYFIRNKEKKIIAVFKPKDEEPYGAQNPKFAKWVQRHCCPCCFGRSCLLLNQGYLSEAGAYVIDQKLGLNVVPKTHVVRLSSPIFHYTKLNRKKAGAKVAIAHKFPSWEKRFRRVGLPFKKGSFQLFVEGYTDSNKWLRKYSSEKLPEPVFTQFLYQFQCMAILDYIIRNTDRGDANWLIRYDLEKPLDEPPSETPEIFPRLKLAAIDNGLAFPFKHPDSWRLFPYHWQRQPFAELPFTEEIVNLVLPKTSDPEYVNGIVDNLKELFKTDHNFSKKFFKRQMRVLKGQIANLNTALRERKSPAELAKMPWLIVKGPKDTPVPVKVNNKTRRVSLDDSKSDINIQEIRGRNKKDMDVPPDLQDSSSSSDVILHGGSIVA